MRRPYLPHTPVVLQIKAPYPESCMLGQELCWSPIDRSAENSPDRRHIQNIYQAIAVKIFVGAIDSLISKCPSYAENIRLADDSVAVNVTGD